MSKLQLRKHISGLLSGLSRAEKQKQSQAIFERLIKHPRYRDAKNLSIYLSTDNEVDTKPMLKYSLEIGGKRCFIPLVRKTKQQQQQQGFETRMIMVELSSMKDYEDLPVNHYGIKEPEMDYSLNHKRANPAEGDLDLVIVPGVAFSLDGRRLGHGKGYYDEFLFNWTREAASKPLYTIGLAFEEQLVDDPLAVEGLDFKLNEIMTSSSQVG